ncbi:caldesmon 1a [Neosynchiropus ocellatus]
MEEMDFERRRELRRQKREEMRLEAERMSRNDDDEEEAARERRRRARQERMRIREAEESSAATESVPISNSHSVSESVTVSNSGGGDDEDQALQDLMAKREERRQRRLREAQERQRLLDAENSAAQVEQERSASWRRGRRGEEEEEEKTYRSRRDEEQREEEEKTYRSGRGEEQREEEEKMYRSGRGEEQREEEEKTYRSRRGEEQREEEEAQVEEAPDAEEEEEVEETPASAYSREQFSERARVREETRKQNGELHQEGTPDLHRKPERTLSRSSLRSPEVASAEQEQDDGARLEAEHKLEELKRRRDDAENEEFERMRQKQQEAEAELEELKRKREERKKVLEEEERHRREEEEQRRAREEQEKRRMKEDIERRRAEAAEKRQKVEDGVDGETKPFKCVSPRGSSLKIGERAEFLNKSAQKSSLKTSHSPVVSKIDNRLEQYTSAAQRENRESRSPRSGATDLPAVTDNIRNIKSMWERGNVFSSPGGAAGTFKEAAVMKTGVAGRINDWLNKTPESAKASGGRPTDLKPVDVTNKRSLWENKGAKVSGRDEHKSVTNGEFHLHERVTNIMMEPPSPRIRPLTPLVTDHNPPIPTPSSKGAVPSEHWTPTRDSCGLSVFAQSLAL